MSSWRSVLDQLLDLDPAELDPGNLSGDEVLESISAFGVALNKLCAGMSRLVRAADRRELHRLDGMATMKTWLTGHCRLSGSEATGLVRAGRRLEQLPELAGAFDRGEVTNAHVQTVTAALTPARVAKAADIDVDLASTDRILTEAARTLGPEDTAKAVRRWTAGVDPDGTLDDAAGHPRNFRMASSSGGRVYLSGHLDPVGGETVHAALEAVMNGYRPAEDERSYPQRLGDALVELCRQSLSGGGLPEVRGERPQVRVLLDYQSLSADAKAAGVAPAELPFAGPITPETARRLACDAQVVRIITGPDGLPLDTGRAQRTVSPAIRRAVELRDGHCVFAGCTAPPAWCDVHHVIHWAHGGVTSCDNGALLCERHHTAVHEGGFRIRREAGTARWHTYRPDGSEILPRGPAP